MVGLGVSKSSLEKFEIFLNFFQICFTFSSPRVRSKPFCSHKNTEKVLKTAFLRVIIHEIFRKSQFSMVYGGFRDLKSNFVTAKGLRVLKGDENLKQI